MRKLTENEKAVWIATYGAAVALEMHHQRLSLRPKAGFVAVNAVAAANLAVDELVISGDDILAVQTERNYYRELFPEAVAKAQEIEKQRAGLHSFFSEAQDAQTKER